jgi:hypothetical protein
MKWTTATLALFSLGSLLLAGKVLLRPERATPAEILDSVQLARSRGLTDAALLLRDLDRAVYDSASDLPNPLDPELATRLLECRAELNAHLGDYAASMADLSSALALGTDRAAEIRLLQVTYQAAAGDRSGALLAAFQLRDEYPQFHPALALAGTLASQEAAGRVQRAVDLTEAVLLHQEAQEAKTLIESIAARDAGADAERARQATLLRSLFLPDHRVELQQTLALLEDASRLNARARHSLALALAGDPDLTATTLLLQLYARAGQDELAAELGSTLLANPPARHSEAIFRLTLQSLARLGQDERAAQLARGLVWDEMRPGPEFCLELANLLFRLGAWGQLSPVSARLTAIQERSTLRAAHFFEGFAYSAGGKWTRAAEALTVFVAQEKGQGPVPFALPHANLQLAHIYRELGKLREDSGGTQWLQLELEHLGAAIGAPVLANYPLWLAEIDAEEFLRFTDLGLTVGNMGFRKPEEYLARALSGSPQRTSEWMEEWNRIGSLSLQRAGYDLPALLASLRAQGRSTPSVDVGPWTLYKIAEAHLKNANPTAAMTVARELLQVYPHLLPALDILIRSQLMRGSREQVLDKILLRIQLVGGDATSSAFLQQVDADGLPSDQRKRLVLQDPANRGRLEVARYLLATGQPARVLVALAPQALPATDGPDNPVLEVLSPNLRLLYARALGDLGRYEEASTLWMDLLDNPVLGPEALVYLVEAQLGSGQSEALEPLVTLLLDALAQPSPSSRAAALRVVDHLLAGGQPAMAERLLAGLDASKELRGGDVLERLALGAAQRGDTQTLELVLERAEAFLANGGAELIRILYTIENRAWPQLPLRVADLRASEYVPSALTETVLSLLEERLEAGHEQARVAVLADPGSGSWAIVRCAAQSLMDAEISLSGSMGEKAAAQMALFLRGVEGARRDPREALGLLLAIEREGWATWALPRLLELGHKGGGVLWPTYLGAQAYESLGQTDLALELYTFLTDEFSGFVAGWNGLESHQLALTGSPISAEVLAVRARRSRVPGAAQAAGSLRVAVDNASRLHLTGKKRQAIRVLEEALALDGENKSHARVFLGRLLVGMGEYRRAASEHAMALASLPSHPGQPLLAEYLHILQRASDENLPDKSRVDLATLEVLLDVQAEHFPRDPLVALERARLGLRIDRRNPTLAAEVVSTLFTRFRRATRNVPLNDLRAGSALPWAVLLTRVSPSLAREFLSSDLENQPGDIDLWHLYADLLAVRGEIAQERALREAIVRMCPEAGAHQDLAWTLLRMGAPLRLVNTHLARAQQAGGPDLPTALRDRASFIRSLATLERADGRGINRSALRNLKRLWARRGNLRSVDLPVLGRQFALGLLRHGEQDDLLQLPQVLAELQALQECDPYTRDFAVALQGLSR